MAILFPSRATLGVLAMLSLSAPAHAKASFERPEVPGGGNGTGIVRVEVPPTAPPTPGAPPPPVVYDTSTFTWSVSPGLFFFPDVGGNTVTSAPGGDPGVVTVLRRDGGQFEFGGIDYAFSTLDTFLDSETLRVRGLRNGVVIGSVSFIQPISNAGFFSTFGAGALAGVEIDELRFELDTRRTVFDDEGFPSFGRFSESIRNIEFADTGPLAGPGPVGPVPEPATWALMITGFGLAGAALRRRVVRRA
jgi:hypothetical protein